MKKGILFDLDGTLLNTLEDLTDAVNATMDHYGCPHRTQAEVRAFIGNGAKRLIALSLPGKEDDPDVDEALAFYQKYYAAHAQCKTRPYDGILEQLAILGKKYPMAIVSNKPDVPVKLLCKQYFGDIYALGETTDCLRKPAPDMLYKAMAHIGVDSFVYVGDSDVDVITANNAGAKCLSVLWGFRDREDIAASGGRYFCDDPNMLAQTLEKMMEE